MVFRRQGISVVSSNLANSKQDRTRASPNKKRVGISVLAVASDGEKDREKDRESSNAGHQQDENHFDQGGYTAASNGFDGE